MTAPSANHQGDALISEAPSRAPAFIIGHGLIGEAVRAMLQESTGLPPVCVGLRKRDVPNYLALDLAGEAGRAALGTAMATAAPPWVILVHGPSDVTWIENNQEAAAAVHCGVAEIVARSKVRAVLVSTDNVFPGKRGRYSPHDQVEPVNVYGRIKAQSEDILLAGPQSVVLRVSLIYGWAGPDQRPTFAQRCLEAAKRGRRISAPTDQHFAPIHVKDVAAVVSAMCQSPGQLTGVKHLAGPVELSRYDFACLAYRMSHADPALVEPCRREDTEWACRPRFSSLSSDHFTDLSGLAAWRPMNPQEGLREMLSSWPHESP